MKTNNFLIFFILLSSTAATNTMQQHGQKPASNSAQNQSLTPAQLGQKTITEIEAMIQKFEQVSSKNTFIEKTIKNLSDIKLGIQSLSTLRAGSTSIKDIDTQLKKTAQELLAKIQTIINTITIAQRSSSTEAQKTKIGLLIEKIKGIQAVAGTLSMLQPTTAKNLGTAAAASQHVAIRSINRNGAGAGAGAAAQPLAVRTLGAGGGSAIPMATNQAARARAAQQSLNASRHLQIYHNFVTAIKNKDEAKVQQLLTVPEKTSITSMLKMFNFGNEIIAQTIHCAAADGKLEMVKALLEINPTLLSEKDKKGKQPIHYAAANGKLEIIKTLLEIDPTLLSATDKEGKKPVDYAPNDAAKEQINKILEEIEKSTADKIAQLEEELARHKAISTQIQTNQTSGAAGGASSSENLSRKKRPAEEQAEESNKQPKTDKK